MVSSSVAGQGAFAQSVPGAGAASSSSSSGTGLSGNLDLGSTTASLTTKTAAPVTINVGGTIGANGTVQGGTSTTVNPGQILTPAQYIAVQQVIHTGQQTLLLSDSGTAIGGFANLRPSYAANLASLTVPQNVSVNAIGFNNGSPLNVSGALNVLGSVYTLQKSGQHWLRFELRQSESCFWRTAFRLPASQC